MKKGINIWSFKGGTPLIEAMKIAKDAEFQGFEPALNLSGELSLESSEKEILNIKQIAQEIDIKIPSLASGLYWSYNYTSSDKGIVQKAKDITRKQLEFAKLLGADTILVVPGSVHTDFIPNCEIIDYDIAYERSLETMLELKEYAEELKINIGIENVWNKFLLSPMEFRNFIDEIDSPYVGAYFDVGNVLPNGFPEHWIKILGNRIKKVHFKDFRRSVGNINGFVDLLAGNVDFPKVVKALENIGYEDYVTAEVSAYNHPSNHMVYSTSNAMDVILNHSKL
ncbi:sugar phosphate isomerase/epimerase family protein [Clostridium sp.]|uniref:sugar phosphate isomerase/epimerase family protein n=1 Tax=Clostridium sp. TaxID=1506 RepID=UPI00346434E8